MSAVTIGFKARRRSIGMTALIDVVFILLMFFMLTSSFSQWSAVDMSALAAVESREKAGNQIVLLNEDLSLEWERSEHRLNHFQDLNASHAQWFDEGAPVLLVSDANVSIQNLVSAMDVLNGLGELNVNYGGSITQADVSAAVGASAP